MCTRPIEQDGKTFACRTCEECLKIRRAQWVARMLAEKTQHKFGLSITLTYDEETQENRDAARMFAYADVQAFLRRLRQAARRAGQPSGIRFVVAGEQGERRGRCHWHIVLYSDTDLRRLGKVIRFGKQITDPEKMMTEGKIKRRCHWSIWGKGFVTFQKADLAEMRYVAWYVVMDQYTDEKSKGTAREATVLNFATGLFRMSKRPAIGERWLIQKMETLDRKGAVLPNLNLTVPGMPGYWQPSGSFRKKLLWHLVALNQRILWTTGAPAPQWSTLLSNLADSPSDRSILDGTAQAEQLDDGSDDLGREIAISSRPASTDARRDLRRRCGRQIPCRTCLDALGEATLERLGLERQDGGPESIWSYRDVSGLDHEDRQRTTSQPNPHCLKRRTDPEGLRLAFPLYNP